MLRHILTPTQRLSHPFHPHVFLLKLSSSVTVIELATAMEWQVSPGSLVYVAHEPSGFGLGVKSGREPDEQQTCWPG